ncbi:type II toxin-antitoxin system Phd/YefM family antitoxin [Agromyces aerolatus]|uniref:type II toxin-antitoxin system Phd/YefM family antitoxin n=1 Tax=Agromyces sp. LY-1074 TaxID=3074080 RepID=UPI002862AEAF|nr:MULTISPECIES: type II toxin-antitoxin system prevent-host-death family antitoxin [unclassified Agromyces]MDR5698876.1 type II toxin-antitoxin system prevent-host-death family antitoxin [Agromyces sp. LY-1074]MDR5705346.1 type II toxin-antitoxin system prevent-host-death family antitoxin [Agromyces sp. LY-1358]
MAITASEARSDLFGLIERVNLDQTEVEITSKRGSAVLMSKDEYDSLIETTYLLRSPKNARRLMNALDQARAGTAEERGLVEP